MTTLKGRFGQFGGQFVPETLMTPLHELEEAYENAKNDPEFQQELAYYLKQYVGRETPLYFAERLTQKMGGAKIYLKREDLNTIKLFLITKSIKVVKWKQHCLYGKANNFSTFNFSRI